MLVPLFQVDEKVDEYSKYLFEPADTNWSMVYEDGDMKVSVCYKLQLYSTCGHCLMNPYIQLCKLLHYYLIKDIIL